VAEKRQQQSAQKKPANHVLVLDVLRRARGPLSAYDIIDKLRTKGVTAPTTVYRALNRLIEDGEVHRLESMAAFVACTHPSHAGTAIFAICGTCHTVTEIEDAYFTEALTACADRVDFRVEHTTVEIQGQCGRCAREETDPH